jgi:hypothetical protein
MNIAQFYEAHCRETDKLIDEIRAFRQMRRSSCDVQVHDGFLAQIEMLENLGVRLYAVDDIKAELKKLSDELFPQ